MKLLKKLLRPHGLIAWPLILTGFGLVIFTLASGKTDTPLAYGSYGLSALALTLLACRLPGTIRFWLRLRRENPFLVRYFSDMHYRLKLSLYLSTGINLLYAGLQLASGIMQASIWFYALAVYYALLAVMRFFLLHETRLHTLGKDRFREYCRYRLIAVLLLVLNLAMGAISAFVVMQNRGFRHHEIVTIAMAAYTFYSLTTTIISIFRYRRFRSPVLSASKHIALASALVSMLSLETAMFSSFGRDTDPALRFWITALSGAAIFLIVLSLAVYMLVLAHNELNKMKGMSHHGSGNE